MSTPLKTDLISSYIMCDDIDYIDEYRLYT